MSKLTNTEPCNLFIRRDFRGFQRMLDAKESGVIDFLQWDAERDGINVSVRDYQNLMGGGGR